MGSVALDGFMEQRLPAPLEDKCLVDVGACDRGLSPEGWGHYHLFEPDPRNVKKLRWRYEGRPDVTLYPVALGDKPGKMELVYHEHAGLGSLAPEKVAWVDWSEPVGEVTVDVITLDSLGLENVGLIKIDTEGFEVEVIKGAMETIRKSRPILLIETHTFEDMAYLVADVLKGYDNETATAEGQKGFIYGRPWA